MTRSASELAPAGAADLASSAAQGADSGLELPERTPASDAEQRLETRESGGPPVPRVSIGLPVYNGENYVESSLDSLLAQTFRDFELIIADNASTDRTPEICAAAASRDPRVRLIQNPTNIGGFANHNVVAREARGEFFMWAGHDDLRAPHYLERCVEELEAHPEAVLCYTRTRVIDETGAPTDYHESPLRAEDPDRLVRFRSLMSLKHRLEPIYGVCRRSVLMQTTLQDLYPDSDRTLLAELALHGPFIRLEEDLFERRDHADRSIRKFASRQKRNLWIHPGQPQRLWMPYHRQLWELFLALGRSRTPWRDRPRCWVAILQWSWEQREEMWSDWVSLARVLKRRAQGRPAPWAEED